MAEQGQSPFHEWVPRRLGIAVAFVILVSVMLLNGSYVGNGININSALGLLFEDISMAYYATSIGMGIAYPLIGIVRTGINSKSILLMGLSLQVVLCFMCAHLESLPAMVFVSFVIGVLKGFALIETFPVLMPFFSKKLLMMEFNSWLLPINFSIGQVGIMMTAACAYYFEWRYIYYAATCMLLVAIFLVMICFRRTNSPIRISFSDFDLVGAAYMTMLMLAATYALTYGRTMDWFNSPKITGAALAVPVLLALFAVTERGKKNPYLHWEILKNRKTLLSHVYMFGSMMLAMSSYMVSYYADSVLHLDGMYTNSLNIMLIPGFAAAGFACFWWSRFQPFRFRYLISISVLSYAGYAALIYFQIRTDSTYESLLFPSVLRGFGMLTGFIAFSAYSVEELPPSLRLHNAFFFLAVRSALGMVAGTCLFANWLQSRTFYYLSALGREIDAVNPLAADYIAERAAKSAASGSPGFEAAQLALNDLYQRVYAQATVCAIKEIMGYVLIFTLVAAAITALVHFNAVIKMKVPAIARWIGM